MSMYDDYVYSPLQVSLSPIVKIIPRYIYLNDGKQRIPIFTANIVTLSRTFLVIPIAWSLKYVVFPQFYIVIINVLHQLKIDMITTIWLFLVLFFMIFWII